MKPTGIHYVAEFIFCASKAIKTASSLENILEQGIAKSGLHVVSIHSRQFDPVGATVVAIVTESHIALHTYPEARHVSVDIFTCSPTPEAPLKLLKFLQRSLRPKTVRVAKINRGNPLEMEHVDWMTGFSVIGFEVKYHVKKMIVSKRSQYQKIDVIENDNFGRMLFLNNDLQIAERDVDSYTKNLVLPLIEEKSPLKNVGILGGGDGSILYELLQHKPKKVTLVEIDPEVIRIAKKHLPKVCNKSFSHPRAKIVIDDAYHYLAKHHALFDAVIYDLTWHPEAFTAIDRERFLTKVFSTVKKGLKPGGMITMQCCPEVDKETMRITKKILKKYFVNVRLTSVFIPSCCVNWVFAFAQKE